MIEVSIDIKAAPEEVWTELSHLSSHHEWMADAKEILFETDQREGIGTRMIVPTQVGPFTTEDQLTITEWREGRAIGVEHRGAVSGRGRFVVTATEDGTSLVWTEELRFPWYFGGPIGALLAWPLLKRMWRENLNRLASRVESR